MNFIPNVNQFQLSLWVFINSHMSEPLKQRLIASANVVNIKMVFQLTIIGVNQEQKRSKYSPCGTPYSIRWMTWLYPKQTYFWPVWKTRFDPYWHSSLNSVDLQVVYLKKKVWLTVTKALLRSPVKSSPWPCGLDENKLRCCCIICCFCNVLLFMLSAILFY